MSRGEVDEIIYSLKVGSVERKLIVPSFRFRMKFQPLLIEKTNMATNVLYHMLGITRLKC